jgi:hypothetical protein
MRAVSYVLAVAGLVLLTSSCNLNPRNFGLPRTAVSVVSPDGQYIAKVRNHPCIDPPCQSLWVGRMGGAERQLRRLGEDSDWCLTVVWSADNRTAAFLIQDARLVTVDAPSGLVLSEMWLTEHNGAYPPSRMATELALSSDGRRASFRDCRRNITRPGYVFDASECSDIRTTEIRPGV